MNKNLLLSIAAGLGAAYLFAHSKVRAMSSSGGSGPMSEKYSAIRELITHTADAYHVPAKVAMRFAWLESRFNPNAEGDLDWSKKPVFKKAVSDNKKFANNPYRTDPSVWHSYGLFQLLSPYFVNGEESPKILLDPKINADRAMRKIAAALAAAKGDDRKARLIYTGASKAGKDVQDKILAKYDSTASLFS